ncbi:MAG: T9SS type A sorting domain-containing protein, partial [Flavobacteriales bacterium]|nr:T9SS type A sorting domain-containing protein [Flavobacteriales bacterium]
SCKYASGCDTCSGETDGTGFIVDNDLDNDGVCNANEIVGCMDDTRCNYNALATDDAGCLPALDGDCESCSGESNGTGFIVDNDSDNDGVCDANEIVGCMDDTRCNYNASATDDVGCLPALDGACESCSGESNGTGFVVDNDSDNDGLCDSEDTLSGCVDVTACNYNESPTLNADNITCTYSTDLDACATCSGEQDGTGTIVDNDLDDDGVCYVDEVLGCTDILACNYDETPTIDTDNTTCKYASGCDVCSGETDGTGFIVDNDFDDDGVCDLDEIDGCMDDTRCNYNVLATDDVGCLPALDGVCESCSGETDGTGTVVDNDVDDDGVCDADEIEGCTDDTRCNYNASATDDDGSCLPALDEVCESCSGETDGTGTIVDNDSDNDGLCNVDDILSGCVDDTACNYNASSTINVDNSLCIYSTELDACASCSGEQDGTGTIVDNDLDNDGYCNYGSGMAPEETPGCTYNWADNYNTEATDNDGSCTKPGCTNILAENYQTYATEDDGSCNLIEYAPLEVELKVNNPCDDSSNYVGSIELIVTGGQAPIEIDAFGLDIENGLTSVSKTDTTYKVINIPVGTGYRIYIADASSVDYSFEDSNYSPTFDVRKLKLDVEYDEVREELSYTTNASVYDYIWYRDDVSLGNASESLSDVANGLYRVQITDQYGCVVNDSVEVVNFTVGVEELDKMSLEIYPNPSDGSVYVNYNLPQEMLSSIHVISLTGEIVHTVQLDRNARVETALHLNGLSAGMYLLQIDMDEQKVYRRITIK